MNRNINKQAREGKKLIEENDTTKDMYLSELRQIGEIMQKSVNDGILAAFYMGVNVGANIERNK